MIEWLLSDRDGEWGRRLGDGEVGVGGRAATRWGGRPPVKAWALVRVEKGLGKDGMVEGTSGELPGKPKKKIKHYSIISINFFFRFLIMFFFFIFLP